MSRRGSRSLLASPAGKNPTREKSPSVDEKGDNEEKRNQRRNKLFRRIQMDIKVYNQYIILSHWFKHNWGLEIWELESRPYYPNNSVKGIKTDNFPKN